MPGSRYGRVFRVFVMLAAVLLSLSGAGRSRAFGEDLTALAVLDPNSSYLKDAGQGLTIRLGVSQAIPYRVSFLADPPRLVLDFREVDFGAVPPAALDQAERVTDLSFGPFLSGWSRLVAVLDRPLRLTSAQEADESSGGATIRLSLLPTTPEDFAARIARDARAVGDWAPPKPVVADGRAIRRQTGESPLKIVLDPGHGGIDPGAEAGTTKEATIVLAFALELAERLRRDGIVVTLTRDSDVFVPLETRISVARAAQADVFLSLHADALEEGEANGATIYKLARAASDVASAQLAERHDRADILAGVDLTGNDDEVAAVLLDLARTETQPRADRLAAALTDAIKAANLKMHRHPVQEAAFSVLKSADIPSLLLEIGFLSSKADRKLFEDPAWRAGMQEAIRVALAAWAVPDAAEARLLRQ